MAPFVPQITRKPLPVLCHLDTKGYTTGHLILLFLTPPTWLTTQARAGPHQPPAAVGGKGLGGASQQKEVTQNKNYPPCSTVSVLPLSEYTSLHKHPSFVSSRNTNGLLHLSGTPPFVPILKWACWLPQRCGWACGSSSTTKHLTYILCQRQ